MHFMTFWVLDVRKIGKFHHFQLIINQILHINIKYNKHQKEKSNYYITERENPWTIINITSRS